VKTSTARKQGGNSARLKAKSCARREVVWMTDDIQTSEDLVE
jgi:hypothetical protein